MALFETVLANVSGVGVEIGCLDGYSSQVILAASKLYLTSIDPFIPDSMEASLCGLQERYAENVSFFEGRAALIKDYSWNAVRIWDKPLDFLFIDGDHRYAAVVKDFEDWTPKLKVGGLLAIHDSRMGRPDGANFHPGPSQAAKELIFSKPDKWQVVGEAFSLTVVKKL